MINEATYNRLELNHKLAFLLTPPFPEYILTLQLSCFLLFSIVAGFI